MSIVHAYYCYFHHSFQLARAYCNSAIQTFSVRARTRAGAAIFVQLGAEKFLEM